MTKTTMMKVYKIVLT